MSKVADVLRFPRRAAQFHALREEVRTLRRELHDRMLQYNFQLGRLMRVVAASEVGASVRAFAIAARLDRRRGYQSPPIVDFVAH